jgi:hypothetical protein
VGIPPEEIVVADEFLTPPLRQALQPPHGLSPARRGAPPRKPAIISGPLLPSPATAPLPESRQCA